MSKPRSINADPANDSSPVPRPKTNRRKKEGTAVPTAFRDTDKDIKRGIWLYFLLLIFEGALRKWGPPALSTPLLVIRDPIALLLLGMAYTRGKLPLNPYVLGMGAIGLLGAFTAVTMGHGSLPVAIYGARTLLFHFPLVFVIGRVFERKDIIKMGKVTLWITIPMTILIGLQFYSPQSAWVNRGLAGDTAGAGFSGALGFLRPPGTFSFTNGTTLFYSFAAPFICYFWLEGRHVHKLILVGATIGLIASIPISISRSLLFQVGISLIFTLLAISRRPKYAGRLAIVGIGIIIAVLLLGTTSFFGTAVEAFTNRFDNANEVEGGLVEGVFMDRFFGGLIGSLMESGQQPIFGYGIGMGTNVGSMLLSGDLIFMIAEGEWGRTIGELGPLLGLAVIGFRLSLAWKFSVASYQRLVSGDLLPWMLLSFGLLTVAQGGWAQPTALGFFTIIAGLLMASLKRPKKSTSKDPGRA